MIKMNKNIKVVKPPQSLLDKRKTSLQQPIAEQNIPDFISEPPKQDNSHIDITASIKNAPSTSAEYEICSWFLRLTPELMPIAQAVASRLKANDFIEPLFKSVYQGSAYLVNQGKISGASAVLDYAHQHRLAITASDLTYIIEDVISQTADIERIQQNVDIILDHSQRRSMKLLLLSHIEELDRCSAKDVKAKLSAALEEYDSISSTDNEPAHISEVMDQVINDFDQDEDSQSNVIATGFVDLDEYLGGGLRGADYKVLAGRPSMGKTGLALNIGRNVSMDTRHFFNVLFFSLEMSAKDLAHRLLSAESAIPMEALRIGGDEILGNSQYLNSLSEVMPRFANHNADIPHISRMWIDDQGGLTVSQIVTRAKEFIRKKGKSLIIIDYLQFISTTDLKGLSRNEQIASVSRSLKNLAKDTDCPVIALSQLSRELEKRTDKRPIMSDLRESGSIEQDADIIIFVYRDSVYNPDTSDPTQAELIIAKQRQGALGTVPVTFNSQCVRFSNRANYA